MKAPNDPLTAGIKYITVIANGLKGSKVIKDYFAARIDSRGHYTLPWPELSWVLQNNFDLFVRFLLKLNLYQRRLVLLREEIIGFTQTELYDLYGIHKDLISIFLGRKKLTGKNRKKTKPPIIRGVMLSSNEYDIDEGVISFLAMLMRVPPSWIMMEEPGDEWITTHYSKTTHLVIEGNGVGTLLQDNKSHDVIPIILNVRGTELHLRLERIGKSFILEYVNTGIQLGAFEELVTLTKGMNVKIGIVSTVIRSQKNLLIISGDLNELNLPEFKKLRLYGKNKK